MIPLNKTINLNISDYLTERSKYVLKKLDSHDADYEFIQKSFEKSVSRKPEIVDFVIYRVSCRHSDDEADFSGSMLLKHGSSCKNIVSILENGFQPSTAGLYGQGIYFTHSFTYALTASIKINHKVNKITDLNDKGGFILLNAISNKVQLAERKLSTKKTEKTVELRKNPYERYTVSESSNYNLPEKFEHDSQNNKLRVSMENATDRTDHFVCEKEFVKPKYLVQCILCFNLNNK